MISDEQKQTLKEMIGETFNNVESKGDELIFHGETSFKFFHHQDCCEDVEIEEVVGDLNDLIGNPIIKAEVVSNEGEPPVPEFADSWTWTFYKFATIKGEVTVRWLGQSNGFYSEYVDVAVMRPEETRFKEWWEIDDDLR